MSNSNFTIMVDTSYDLPQEYIEKHDIEIIPIPFNLNGKQHSGGRWQEISDTGFYDALRDGGLASTALINPDTYLGIFKQYASQNKPLLMIVLSSGLSGTFQNSAIALEDCKRDYPDCEIYTVDSYSAAGGTGLIVAMAVAKRAAGLSCRETAEWLEARAQSCISLFTVNDLMYLHRGGRLSKLSAVAGSIIGIKPLLNVAPDGTLKLKDKVRGRKSAIEGLYKQMLRSIDPAQSLETVVISHSNCLEDAETLADMIRGSIQVKELLLAMMGPVIGAHVGPGTIALFFESIMTRSEYEAKFYPK